MYGGGNKLVIKDGCFLNKPTIHIIGNKNKIIFEEECIVGPDCSFWLEGDNIEIVIGAGTTFTRNCQINAQENNSKIIIGQDCMFSNHIIVRTSDSHPIYSLDTMNRINFPKNVIIGKHVWIAPGSEIMKGALIEDDVIIGSQTMVSHHIPSHCLAVGRPAKIVKENVTWSRKDIIFNNGN